jgi:outer membrane protein
MLQVMMPLFSGGEIQARLKQSLAQQDKAQDAIESASFTAEKDARENYAAYLKARVRSISLEQLLQTSKEALAATETGFKVGSRTQVDVLRALDSYFTVRRDLMRSRYEVIVSSLQLKANVASLTIDDISYANTLLCCAKTSDNGPSLR